MSWEMTVMIDFKDCKVAKYNELLSDPKLLQVLRWSRSVQSSKKHMLV